MTVLVTGATGYIGHALALHLASLGWHVRALCRSQANGLSAVANIEVVRGCLSDTYALKAALTKCDQLYHLAAFARVWSRDPSAYYSLNVDATCRLLALAAEQGVRKMVFTSSAGVFGPSERQRMVREEDVRTVPFFNDYERSKYQAEEACRSFARQGLHVVIVNPSRVYGSGIDTPSNAISRLIKLYASGKWPFIPGDGKSVGNYAYLSDVVRGHVLAMEKGRPGERYILGGENCSYEHFFTLLRELSGIRRKLYHLPLGALLAFSRVEEWKANLFNVAPLITPQWVKKYLFDWALDCTKAKDELGYEITPLRVGLSKTINDILGE